MREGKANTREVVRQRSVGLLGARAQDAACRFYKAPASAVTYLRIESTKACVPLET